MTVKYWLCRAIVALVLFNAHAARALDVVPEDSWLFYEIGGGRAFTIPAHASLTRITLDGNSAYNVGFSCGAFDASLSIGNMLNDLAGGVEDMYNQLELAARSAIASLPMLILQRAAPGIYDLFQNGLSLARHEFQLATKTCQQIEQEIAQGQNPYDEWVTVSKTGEWRALMGTGGADVVEEEERIEESAGEDGFAWVGGADAGGRGQPEVRVIGDVARAGANLLMGRAADDTSAFSAPTSGGGVAPRLPELWSTPDEVAAWLTTVVGERVIRTYEGGERQSTPGKGLLPFVAAQQLDIDAKLKDLIAGVTTPTPSNLDEVAAPGPGLTKELIDAFRWKLSASEQAIYGAKLAGEVSLSRVLERALLARRVLLAGRAEPNVAQNGPALSQLETSVAELETEIDNLLFEHRTRREVVSHTSAAVLGVARLRANESRGRPVQTLTDPRGITEEGVVK